MIREKRLQHDTNSDFNAKVYMKCKRWDVCFDRAQKMKWVWRRTRGLPATPQWIKHWSILGSRSLYCNPLSSPLPHPAPPPLFSSFKCTLIHYCFSNGPVIYFVPAYPPPPLIDSVHSFTPIDEWAKLQHSHAEILFHLTGQATSLLHSQRVYGSS